MCTEEIKIIRSYDPRSSARKTASPETERMKIVNRHQRFNFGDIPKKVVDLVTHENVAAYTNSEILTEYNVTASKVITKKNGHINQNLFDQFIKAVHVIDNVTVVDVCRDPDDNKFIAFAVDAKAIYIVSGDKDL